MKRSWILPSVFLMLLLVLIGSVAFLPAAAETITGSAKFDPDRIDLALPAPSVVNGTIRFPSGPGPTVKDINASTILLEGSLPPDTTYLIPGGLVATFDGEMVVNILWAKVYHMGMPGAPWKIWLTITGNLNDAAGGTPFSATGYIKVGAPHPPPPP